MKKGRHRRYEEARALKQNEDLDLDSIFESLNVDEPKVEGESPAFDAWRPCGLPPDASSPFHAPPRAVMGQPPTGPFRRQQD